MWLKPDHIIIYDRATTTSAGLFKKFNLTLLAQPIISGNTATVTTAGGQEFYIQSLLPAGASITSSPVENFQSVAELDPTAYRLAIQDASNPANERFLTVLQGADAGVSMKTGTVIQSSSGPAFTGAAVADTAVMFPVNAAYTFSTLTYSVPAAVTGQLVTGLTPNGLYTVKLQAVSGGTQVTISAGGTAKADSGGVLAIGMQ